MDYFNKQIEKLLKEHIERAAAETFEKLEEDGSLSPYTLEVPREKEHGDYATNLALILSGRLKRSPREIAEQLAGPLGDSLKKAGIAEQIEVAGPGFINFFLDRGLYYRVLTNIEEQGDSYGYASESTGRKIQVEFVSANPTGPLTIGHARGAAYGDVLASILEAAGHEVEREYYFNDAGRQMDLLARSLFVRYLEEHGVDCAFPEDGYRGDYIREIAREIADKQGDRFFVEEVEKADDEVIDFFRRYGRDRILEMIAEDLVQYGIEFDVWYTESSLREEGKVDQVIADLKSRGYVYEKEGAVWLETTRFGDDKDRVLVKNNGDKTYFAPDIAYHQDKYERGFDLAIDIWGGDHHGYVSRMKAAVQALGYPKDWLEPIIVQMISLRRGGKEVKMSTRAAQFIPLRELIEEVGADVARYFFIMRSADSHMVFDWDLALEESRENPVYYIQYGFARISSLLERAEKQGVPVISASEASLDLLSSEEEFDLMKKLADFPDEIANSAEMREPHRLANYAHELASLFHAFYTECQVIGENQKLSQARLVLVKATQTVLRNVLHLMGLSAPEEM